MNENIDLTKILEGCPEGTEFYHTMYGQVQFVRIELNFDRSLILRIKDTAISTLTKRGTWDEYFDGECLLFPSKDQRDWSKFERFWDKPKVDKFDPHTFQPFDKVLCRDFKYEPWNAQILSNIRDGGEFNYQCLGTSFKYCIPYNDETKHLVGKTDDCPEYYKCWEE